MPCVFFTMRTSLTFVYAWIISLIMRGCHHIDIRWGVGGSPAWIPQQEWSWCKHINLHVVLLYNVKLFVVVYNVKLLFLVKLKVLDSIIGQCGHQGNSQHLQWLPGGDMSWEVPVLHSQRPTLAGTKSRQLNSFLRWQPTTGGLGGSFFRWAITIDSTMCLG